MTNCTIRNIPEPVEERLAREASRRGLSLEQAALEVLAEGLGLGDLEFEYYELELLEQVDGRG